MVNSISGIKTGKGLKISNIKISRQKGFKEELQKLRTGESNSLKTVNVQMNNFDNKQADRILKNIFHTLDTGHKKIENILKISLSGIKLNQQELLTLQMRVYRFTQEVELISKLVEKGTSGIKQVVNTQV